jgi:hypothetical protein
MVDMEYQDKPKVRNGSFRVRVPICRNYETIQSNGIVSFFPKQYEEIDSVIHTVQMLTQNDYAEGWQQMVPKAKHFTKNYVDSEGNHVSRVFTNAYRMKVNLAQLPEYLWHRIQRVDMRNSTVNNGYHYYTVENTNVDDEIRELAHILNISQELSLRAKYKERVHELLNILKDNDVYGWVVIRAKTMYH